MAGDPDGGGDTIRVILPILSAVSSAFRTEANLGFAPGLWSTAGEFGGGGDTTALPHQNVIRCIERCFASADFASSLHLL